jgi:hypothetical protein
VGSFGLHPKTYRYASKRSGDEELRIRLRELASQRRRFGYRRLGLMLKRQGIKLNRKKLYRLYKEERLTVRRHGGRKRALGTRGHRWRSHRVAKVNGKPPLSIVSTAEIANGEQSRPSKGMLPHSSPRNPGKSVWSRAA